MQERPIIGFEFQHRKPMLGATLIESEKILSSTLGINIDLMGKSGPADLTMLYRDNVRNNHIYRLLESNALSYEMAKKGLSPELISPVSIVEPVVINGQFHLSVSYEDFQDVLRNNLPNAADMESRIRTSKSAVRLFDVAAIRALEYAAHEFVFENTPPEAVDFYRGILKEFLNHIANTNENTVEILNFSEEFDKSLKEDPTLKFIARGAQVELWVNRDNKDLKVIAYPAFYQDAVLEQIITAADEKFTEQMRRRHGNWFVKPKEPVLNLGVSEETRGKVVDFLNKLGINADKPDEITVAYLSSELALHLGASVFGLVQRSEAFETENEGANTYSDSESDEEKEFKKLLRKERKAKKKKKNVKPQRTQQRFGKKDSSKSSKTTKEGAMHIVRPDPITAQFERMRRLLENKKRKQAAREKREARERELMEKQQQEERRKARLERQKKAREQKQTRGADSPQTVVIIETPLEKALREANAMQAVLEAEERARSEAQEGAAGSYAEGEKSFASGFEAGTTHSEIEDMEPNEEYLLEEDYEDEVSYKKFESIVRKKKFRD